MPQYTLNHRCFHACLIQVDARPRRQTCQPFHVIQFSLPSAFDFLSSIVGTIIRRAMFAKFKGVPRSSPAKIKSWFPIAYIAPCDRQGLFAGAATLAHRLLMLELSKNRTR